MIHNTYHKYLENLVAQHTQVDGIDAEIAFLTSASEKLSQIAKHAEAVKNLQSRKETIDRLGAEIGLTMPNSDTSIPEQIENLCHPQIHNDSGLFLNLDDNPAPCASGQDQQADGIEPFLPDKMRNPNTPERLRIIRLYGSMSASELARRSGIARNIIYDIENKVIKPSNKQIDILAKALCVSREALTEKPIAEIMPITPDLDITERLRRIRCRAGISCEVLARKLDKHVNQILDYEIHRPSDATIKTIARTIGVKPWIILTANPADADNSANEESHKDNLPTGIKIKNARIQAGMSISRLAKAAGFSASHLSNIEAQKSLPGTDILNAIARALSVPVASLSGTSIRQPRAMYTSRKEQKA